MKNTPNNSLLLAIAFVFIINTLNAQTKAKHLDSLFSSLYKNENFNGCVLVAENGKPIYEKAFGYANLDTRQPLTNKTMFELASVSKQFTAMAIMQLEEKGKLSYKDSIRKFFPELPFKGVTIEHLLHHSSGIPEFLGWDEKRIDVKKINYNQDILKVLIHDTISVEFKPGDKLSYSNTNYLLLALVVEKVSGLSFDQYLKKYIFKPLKMSNTQVQVYVQRAAKEKITDYALSYIYDSRSNTFVIPENSHRTHFTYYLDGIAGPYGISSNVEDLLKWDQALNKEKAVNKETMKKAFTPARLNNDSMAYLGPFKYGYGWLLAPYTSTLGNVVLHSGGYPGYQAMIIRYQDKLKTIILLTNKWEVFSPFQLTKEIENILFDKPFNIPKSNPFKKRIVVNPEQIKGIEGVYAMRMAPQVKFTITSEIDRVFAQLTGQIKAEIYPESESEYFYTVVDARIKFIKNEKGVIDKLILYQNGKEIEAIKEAY